MFGLSLTSTVKALRRDLAMEQERIANERKRTNDARSLAQAKSEALRLQSQLADARLSDINRLNDEIVSCRRVAAAKDVAIESLNEQMSSVIAERDRITQKCSTLEDEAVKLRGKLYITKEYMKAIESALSASRSPMFISGPAGTGKSKLINLIRNIFSFAHPSNGLAVVAPTGIAAENIKGQTIHSFFGFPPVFSPNSKLTNQPKDNPSRRTVQLIDTIIVDEASMVAPDLVDSMDKTLRELRPENRELPFGGAKIIFVGDLGQLPPVITNANANAYYDTYGKDHPHFFDAKALSGSPLCRDMIHHTESRDIIRLTEIFRQSEKTFIDALLHVRLGPDAVTENDISILKGCYCENVPSEEERTTLYPKNADVDSINQKALDRLPGKMYRFVMKTSGEVSPEQKKNSIYPEVLCLKVGARVINLKNKGKLVNGSIGIVTAIDAENDIVNIRLRNGETATITREEEGLYETRKSECGWENVPVGTIRQLPLKLSWALTIHKSQGQTFDDIYIDLGGARTVGQAYTALSRVRTLAGLHLLQKFDVGQIIFDPSVTDWL